MIANDNSTNLSYQKLYEYMAVLSEEQIKKLRNIAIGLKQVSTFSPEEVVELEMKVRERESSHRYAH